MSVYESYKKRMKIDTVSTGKNYPTLGEKLKSDSDLIMEETFWNDPQSKICYIYDYFHDNEPDKNVGMTYENTTKTRIDAKFIVKSYQSLDKDQVEYYLQFRPSQKTKFNEDDELYYFETDYRNRYGVQDFPIGMMVDIPDDEGCYHKWLICEKEQANQFIKYLIIPCNYYLTWIERDGQNRHKRGMWCSQRQQSSYTMGSYRDRFIAHPDNQTKLWIPLNSITEKLWYNDDINQTMRLIVSAKVENPLIWSITKIENFKPVGIQKITLYQNYFDPIRDYIEHDENGQIIAMYADYYDSIIEPEGSSAPSIPSQNYGKIIASTSTVKVGGSYKSLTLEIYDKNNIDVTSNYSESTFVWTCSIESEDLTDKVTWLDGKLFNQKKIKFPDDRKYLGKTLDIKCVIKDIEIAEQFELVI